MQLLQMANHLVLTDMNKTSLLVNIRTMVEVFGESIFVRCTIAEKWQMRIQTIENGKNVSPWKSRRDNVKETKLRAIRPNVRHYSECRRFALRITQRNSEMKCFSCFVKLYLNDFSFIAPFPTKDLEHRKGKVFIVVGWHNHTRTLLSTEVC